jgi:putative membrane protein
MMLQLVSAGGIYPVETTAKPFQIVHPFDPMTYAVNGLRLLTVGGGLPTVDRDRRAGRPTVVSLAVSAWSARRNRQCTMERLHPPIEV